MIQRCVLLSLAAFLAAGASFAAEAGTPNNAASLRAAIGHLSARFPESYPGAAFLSRLDALGDTPAAQALDKLRAEALLANPLLQAHPIMYVVRRQYAKDHHNTETIFQTGEINTASFVGGGALKCVDFADGGRVRTLVDAGAEGLIRDPEVSFDGTRILFSMRKSIDDDYHVYEVDADGANLRQLTSAKGVADIDPLYLPGGDIVFSSTREPKYCMCNRHIMANLFRMESDGANIHQIGKSTLFEGHAALLPDGRLLYDRWEYVDRNFGDAQALWTANPDGTNHAVYYGNNMNSPGGVIDARPIPGTQQVLCVFGSCHDLPWGALAIVDRRRAIDGRDAVLRTWPDDAIERVGVGNWDAFKPVVPKYEDPYPLDDSHYLCARMTGNGSEMGIYLLDRFGNEILLHAEGPGCYDPMPLGPRTAPPCLPERSDLGHATGAFYVADVYAGTHMAGVARGSIKYLRVVESPEKQTWVDTVWNGQGRESPAMNWHDFNNKRILGTVPVEEDGSAHLEVPADTFVYFQLLDANKMMVQSMRSGTLARPGEILGCVGCHDNRLAAPLPTKHAQPIAFQRGPSKMDGWYGPARFFDYAAEVQPVFDRHCVQCHDYGKGPGKRLNLSGDKTETFNTSYNELWRKGYIAAIGAGPSETQPAYGWGSHVSGIVGQIMSGHKQVQLDREEFERIVTWIDINAPYYPRYSCAYPDNLAGRCPLDNAAMQRLSDLTGVPLLTLADHAKNQGPQINFTRPTLSPCLKSIVAKPEEHQEALAIIEQGQRQLAERPEADMPGFVPHAGDLAREQKYVERDAVERRNVKALLEGDKVYDDAKLGAPTALAN